MVTDIKYEIILYWSKEDQAFIAEVPELPGCAADGATYQEAVANVEVVIQEWIETAQQLGRPIPVPRASRLWPAWPNRLIFDSTMERRRANVRTIESAACGPHTDPEEDRPC